MSIKEKEERKLTKFKSIVSFYTLFVMFIVLIMGFLLNEKQSIYLFSKILITILVLSVVVLFGIRLIKMNQFRKKFEDDKKYVKMEMTADTLMLLTIIIIFVQSLINVINILAK